MIKDIPGLIENLKVQIKMQTDVAIIGLSGGADSTLVAILCRLALGKENVVGIHMPYGKTDTSGTKFNARSVRFARHLEIKEEYIPITEIADAITKAIVPHPGDHGSYRWGGEEAISNLDKGNACARSRMAVLYGMAGYLAHSDFKGKRIRVIGTGNLSEDFIGYDTKGGDALADFHPIGRLFKSEVYQLLTYFVEQGFINEDHVDRVPSAGLWDGQTDEGELGHTYNEMEPEIRKMMFDDRSGMDIVQAENFCEPTPLNEFVFKRHIANKHKHEAIPSFDVKGFVD